MEFSKYAKIKNNYCICYLGNSDEYLVQLRLLLPILESKFPGLKIHLMGKDDKIDLLGQNGIKFSDLRHLKSHFAHINYIKYNGNTHPIEDLLNESPCVVSEKILNPTTRCAIITQGNYPVVPINQHIISRLKTMAQKRGFDVEIDPSDVNDTGLVVGVESTGLFEAAGRGIETILVPTGPGARLYKRMFPNGVVLHN